VCATVGRARPAVTRRRLRRGDLHLCAACAEAERACRLGVVRRPDGRLQIDGRIPEEGPDGALSHTSTLSGDSGASGAVPDVLGGVLRGPDPTGVAPAETTPSPIGSAVVSTLTPA
jgi:hypothetical protein